jgi:hypothetical protein
MTFCRRILAALTFLLGAAVLLVSLAGGVGVWVVKGPVAARTERVFGKVDAALGVAEQKLGQVQASLGRAAKRLDSAREEQGKLAQASKPRCAVRRTLARRVRQEVAPELGDAQDKLHTVAEAAVVVNSVLNEVASIPLLAVSGLDTDRLRQMNSRLAEVGPAAWELSRLLGESGPEADDADNQLSRVEQTLQTLRGWVADYQPRLTETRQQMQALQSRTLRWITPAAAVISAVCFWVALSQVSLMAHARSWW